MAIEIGQNAAVLASKSTIDTFIGSKAATLVAGISDGNAAKLLLDQLTNPELVAKSYDGGGDGNSGAVNYLRTAALAMEDIWKILNGQTPTKTQPHNYLADLRYVTSVR